MWWLRLVGLVLPLATLAQHIPSGIKYDLSGLVYPDMAALARIQGVVKLELTPTGAGVEVSVIAGPVLLRRVK